MPSKLVRGWVHSDRMIWRLSSSRSARSFRPCRTPGRAWGAVLGPAGADAELQPPAGQVVDGDRHLRQNRRVPVGVADDGAPDPDAPVVNCAHRRPASSTSRRSGPVVSAGQGWRSGPSPSSCSKPASSARHQRLSSTGRWSPFLTELEPEPQRGHPDRHIPWRRSPDRAPLAGGVQGGVAVHEAHRQPQTRPHVRDQSEVLQHRRRLRHHRRQRARGLPRRRQGASRCATGWLIEDPDGQEVRDGPAAPRPLRPTYAVTTLGGEKAADVPQAPVHAVPRQVHGSTSPGLDDLEVTGHLSRPTSSRSSGTATWSRRSRSARGSPCATRSASTWPRARTNLLVLASVLAVDLAVNREHADAG